MEIGVQVILSESVVGAARNEGGLADSERKNWVPVGRRADYGLDRSFAPLGLKCHV
jgi:hypothetical protein